MTLISCRFIRSDEHNTTAVQRYLDALAATNPPNRSCGRSWVERLLKALRLLGS